MKDLISKLLCLKGSNYCIYFAFVIVILINSIILSIERYLCKEDECDNKYTRTWFILCVGAGVAIILMLLLQTTVGLVLKRGFSLSTKMLLLAVFLAVVSVDKLVNYDRVLGLTRAERAAVAEQPEVEQRVDEVEGYRKIGLAVYRGTTIGVSALVLVLLLRKICSC